VIRQLLCLLSISGVVLCSQSLCAQSWQPTFDVVVYGATPSGIMAAVAAAREGLHVALVEPGRHIGGMVASGLSHTDRGNTDTIGGIPREFFESVGRYYGETVEWNFEPHAASRVFDSMLRSAHVAVFVGARLRKPGGVVRKSDRIVRILTEDGRAFAAAEFVDATYEGDLMAESDVSNTWGRESRAQYGESLAGVLATQRMDLQFRLKVSPYASDGSLLPGVSPLPKGRLGQADKKIPSYNFRLCVTTDKTNQVPFPRPDGYAPRQYELLARYLPLLEKSLGRPLEMKDVFLMEPLKGDKWDLNNMGAISTDDTGANWKFPTASYAERAAIFRRHLIYDEGLLYFLGYDPRVPASLQAAVNRYGLAKDEFTDTNHWPWQLYIRESRRMIGEHVFTQHDVLENRTKADSIGIGSYQLDSHNAQRVTTPDGFVENEGDYYVDTAPYEIPYRSIVPKPDEVVNLAVPVCMSATHAAYGTIRQEPVYMILGQAAGTAAAIAFHEHRPLQDVPAAELQAKLLATHAVLHWSAPEMKSSGQ
jgi:FAD dependent oxidoreductase